MITIHNTGTSTAGVGHVGTLKNLRNNKSTSSNNVNFGQLNIPHGYRTEDPITVIDSMVGNMPVRNRPFSSQLVKKNHILVNETWKSSTMVDDFAIGKRDFRTNHGLLSKTVSVKNITNSMKLLDVVELGQSEKQEDINRKAYTDNIQGI